MLPCLAPAQTDRTADTVRFLRQAWATVRREGPKRLDDARVHWPKQIREVERTVGVLQSEWVGKLDSANVREKLALMAELWRIRSSLDLLALASPETLGEVSGTDPKQLSDLRKSVVAIQKRVHLR